MRMMKKIDIMVSSFAIALRYRMNKSLGTSVVSEIRKLIAPVVLTLALLGMAV
jgi:hypothetical protein